jgi:hypothetical protein
MPTYKMILRDADNPETSALHVIEVFTEAANRNEAAKYFEETYGPKNVVAGPLKVDTPTN